MRNKKRYLQEDKLTKMYIMGKLSQKKYRLYMKSLQEKRYLEGIEKKRNRMSMSSTKWK
jgi:hypothetical protein